MPVMEHGKTLSWRQMGWNSNLGSFGQKIPKPPDSGGLKVSSNGLIWSGWRQMDPHSPSQRAPPSCSCRSPAGGCTGGARCPRCWSGRRSRRGPCGGRWRLRQTEGGAWERWIYQHSTNLPFAPFEVILRELGELRPGAGQHLGIVGKIQAEAESKQEEVVQKPSKRSTLKTQMGVNLIGLKRTIHSLNLRVSAGWIVH